MENILFNAYIIGGLLFHAIYWRKTFVFCKGVKRSIIWGGGGDHIHIFLFTDCKNNRFQKKLIVQNTNRAVARALIGGGGCIFIYSCSARLISFEINLKTTDFKRNSSGITRIYEYTPPPPINALATALNTNI